MYFLIIPVMVETHEERINTLEERIKTLEERLQAKSKSTVATTMDLNLSKSRVGSADARGSSRLSRMQNKIF